MKFEELYRLVRENTEEESNHGIIFRKRGDTILGCSIGVRHGEKIWLSDKMIEKIKNIPNLKFYAEGVAAKIHSKEPGMEPFLKKHFSNAKIENDSWDEITEKEDKGSGNPKYNVVYTFMQHEYNKTVDLYDYDKGTMLEAMARPKEYFPKNTPKSFEERLKWLTKHMKKAGFYDKLNQPYDKRKLFNIMTEMEDTVYPKGQEYPDTSTYFGKFQHHMEEERNQTIYDLMGEGACCFAGAGHLIELKQQFPELELIDGDLV